MLVLSRNLEYSPPITTPDPELKIVGDFRYETRTPLELQLLMENLETSDLTNPEYPLRIGSSHGGLRNFRSDLTQNTSSTFHHVTVRCNGFYQNVLTSLSTATN